ncbi:serine/threonine-protein kinase SRPK3 [Xylaria venustula]|nr:serine/threonine-protein kinase SRPK3 [Xylaria venustula]
MSSPATPPRTMPSAAEDSRFEPMGTPCESIDSYRPGGFHPVILGDILHGRYRIIRKLGYGSFATVWLAEDVARTGISSQKKYVALKIHAAKVDVSNELSIQHRLATGASKDTGSNFVLLASDSFTLKGPNGQHHCFVTEPMGPSVSDVLYAPHEFFNPLDPPSHRFSTARNKSILRSVLLGLKFLRNNNIVHGDLQPANLLFPIQGISRLAPNILQQNKSTARIDPVKRKDGKVDRWSPKYLIVAEPILEEGSQVREVVKLADFGCAFPINNPPATPHTPLGYRAPETILGNRVDCTIDIWSFGCLMFELLTDCPLFGVASFCSTPQMYNDDHLIQLSYVIGPLPQHIRNAWPRYTSYFGPSGERLNTTPFDLDNSEQARALKASLPPLPPRDYSPPESLPSLEELFFKYKAKDIGNEEARVLVSLLRDILQIEPSKRPSAAQLLERRWFRV